jgi:hypothetical protein
MEVAGSSVMLVNINQITRRHIQTDSNLHSLRLDNTKSYKLYLPINMALHYTALYHVTVEKVAIFPRIAVNQASFYLCKHSYRAKICVCINGNKKKYE